MMPRKRRRYQLHYPIRQLHLLIRLLLNLLEFQIFHLLDFQVLIDGFIQVGQMRHQIQRVLADVVT